MQSMTPSTAVAEMKTTTVGQIDQTVNRYRTLLEKHSKDFDSGIVQLVLGQPELAEEMFQLLRRRIEAQSNMIVRRAKVDRSRIPQVMIDATGRVQYNDKDVVQTIPRGTGDEVDVLFFKLGRSISNEDLKKEYELRGLKADHYAQAAVNEADPAFADTHPNGSWWQEENGNWCYIAFYLGQGDEHRVDVFRNFYDWLDYWWFAGVRK